MQTCKNLVDQESYCPMVCGITVKFCHYFEKDDFKQEIEGEEVRRCCGIQKYQSSFRFL